jgi:spore maturation protein CgeB
MKIFLVGKSASITHWFEDASSALRAEGHEVRLGVLRHPWLNTGLEALMAEPLAAAMAMRAARFDPDLVLVIGALHAPATFLERLSALPGRPPLVGWVGDAFGASAREAAELYDLVAYTDSGLNARHAAFGFASRRLFLPHAANLGKVPPEIAGGSGLRTPQMVFIGTPTPGRRAVVEAVRAPLTIFGPAWANAGKSPHEFHAARVAADDVVAIYARHMAALNIRNEGNVVHGLNQRSFDPYLSATPVVSDDQADLPLCFEPGREVLVWRDFDELNAHYDRLRRYPGDAVRIGEAGRRRIFVDHGFGQRLETVMKTL